MKFNEIYKPPFHEVLDFWVYTQGNARCFDWIARIDTQTRKELIRILNGNSKKRVKHEVKYDKRCKHHDTPWVWTSNRMRGFKPST